MRAFFLRSVPLGLNFNLKTHFKPIAFFPSGKVVNSHIWFFIDRIYLLFHSCEPVFTFRCVFVADRISNCDRKREWIININKFTIRHQSATVFSGERLSIYERRYVLLSNIKPLIILIRRWRLHQNFVDLCHVFFTCRLISWCIWANFSWPIPWFLFRKKKYLCGHVHTWNQDPWFYRLSNDRYIQWKAPLVTWSQI